MEKVNQEVWIINTSLFVLIGLIVVLIIIIVSYILFDTCTINNIVRGKEAITSGVLIGLSALLAFCTMYKSIENNKKTENKKAKKERSEFFLNSTIKELNIVFDMLEDGNNSRDIWIHSSRLLKYALRLSEKIDKEEHKEVFSIKKEQLQFKLNKVFDRNIKDISFFNGNKNLLNNENNIEGEDITNIDMASAYILFEFIEYSKDYKDISDINMPGFYSEKEKKIFNHPDSTDFRKYFYLNNA